MMSSVLTIFYRHVCLTSHLILELHWDQISLIHLVVWISVQCSGSHYREHSLHEKTCPQKAEDSGVCISAGIALQTSAKQRRIVCRYNWHSVVCWHIIWVKKAASVKSKHYCVLTLDFSVAATYLPFFAIYFFKIINSLEEGSLILHIFNNMTRKNTFQMAKTN